MGSEGDRLRLGALRIVAAAGAFVCVLELATMSAVRTWMPEVGCNGGLPELSDGVHGPFLQQLKQIVASGFFRGADRAIMGANVALAGLVCLGLVTVFGSGAGSADPVLKRALNVPVYLVSIAGLLFSVEPLVIALRLDTTPGASRLMVAFCSVSCLFLTALGDLPSRRELPRRLMLGARVLILKRRLWIGLAVLVVLSLALAIVSARRSPPGVSAAALGRWLALQPRNEELRIPGGPAPNVLVVVFSDYQCPACRAAHKETVRIEERMGAEHQGTVGIQYRDYPLDPTCNRFVRNPVHPCACAAAAAVRIAAGYGQRRRLVEWVYEHQDNLTANAIWAAAARTIAGEVSPAARESALEAVRRDIELGQRLGVRGTPTYFVNGVRLGPAQPDILESAIRLELKSVGDKTTAVSIPSRVSSREAERP